MALQAGKGDHLDICHGRGGGGRLGTMWRTPRDRALLEGRKWTAGGELVSEWAAGAALVALYDWLVGQNA